MRGTTMGAAAMLSVALERLGVLGFLLDCLSVE
jgi:hypothetical protein